MKDPETVATAAGPFRTLLGIEVVNLGEGIATGELPFSDDLAIAQDIEIIHGGAIAAFADSIGAFAIGTLAGMPCPTIDLRTDFLAPATTDLTATGTVIRNGGTVGVADVSVSNAKDMQIATVRGVYKTAKRSDSTWDNDSEDT